MSRRLSAATIDGECEQRDDSSTDATSSGLIHVAVLSSAYRLAAGMGAIDLSQRMFVPEDPRDCQGNELLVARGDLGWCWCKKMGSRPLAGMPVSADFVVDKCC